jgi:hypothetical protein
MADRVIPFSTATQAYGQVRPLLVRPVGPVAPAARPAPTPNGADSFEFSGAARSSHPLAAARVPGAVRFDGAAPAQSAGALPIYTNPADRNTAATGVQAGRVLDVEA